MTAAFDAATVDAAVFDADVLVVGLGPVGATLAALLVRRGISVLAVDREAQIYPLPRAVGFDHEIMRILQEVGLADVATRNTRESRYYDFNNAAGETILRYDRALMPRPSGWPNYVTFYQPAIEAALRETIGASPQGRILLSQRLLSLVPGEDDVAATITGPEGERTVRTRFVIGCDGASSTVRELMGAKLQDDGFDEPWLVVDFLTADEATLPDRNLQLCDPVRPATFMRMGPGRHRWEFMLLPGETAEQMRDEETIRALIRTRGFPADDPMERRAVYRFHALVADRWRFGRVILAGDAAHQTPPFAGQGMCSGLRDAVTLAWRLDFVMAGLADPAILDDYQVEREAMTRFIIDVAIRLGRIVCTTDPAVAAARDTRMRADHLAGVPATPMGYPPLPRGGILPDTAAGGTLFPQPSSTAGGTVSRFDDVLAGRAVLLHRAGPAHPTEDRSLVSLALNDVAVQPFAPALAEWLDARHADAVLIRPDRYVFGTGSPELLAARWSESLAGTA